MASKPDSTWNFLAILMPSTWHSVASLYRLLGWSIVRWGEDGPGVSTPAGQVLDTWWDPARLGMPGVRLPRPATSFPGRLNPGVVYSKAGECQLSSDTDHHFCWAPSPSGVKVMEGGWSSVALLWDPVRLQKSSNPLELMGRVELSSQVSSVRASFHLHPSDLADGGGNSCACESHDS